MLDETLTVLAMTGATTVVAAMATTAWDNTRNATARLFRRSGTEQQQAIEAQLDANAARLTQINPAEIDRQRLIPLWRWELEELLRQHPEAAEELRALVSQAQAALPPAQNNWVMHVTAHENAHAYGVQGGTLSVHNAAPERVQPPDIAVNQDARDVQ